MMNRFCAFVRFSSLLLATALATGICASVSAAPITLGYVAWDVTDPGATGEFDVVNQSGTNASGDATWPVVSQVTFANLSLAVHFTNGATTVFGQSYFTPSPDGLSFDGGAIPLNAALPTEATLTGLVTPTNVTLYSGDLVSITTAFSSRIAFRGGGLADGDLQLIVATPSVTAIAEPTPICLAAVGLLILFGRRRCRTRQTPIVFASLAVATLGLGTTALAARANDTVRLNAWAAPANGVAGTTFVNLTASISSAMAVSAPQDLRVNFSNACGDAPFASLQVSSVRPITGTAFRVQVQLPGNLPTRNYALSLTGTMLNAVFTSENCSLVNVTAAASDWTTLIGRTWTVPPNTEGYKCVRIVLLSDIYVSAFRPVTPAGDPENFLTVGPAGNAMPGDFDCFPGSLNKQGVYASGTATSDLFLPLGTAVHLHAGDQLLLTLHLVNDTAELASGVSAIQVQTVDPTTVMNEAGIEFAGTFLIVLPSDGVQHTATGACLTTGKHVFAVGPRMRSSGVHGRLTLMEGNQSSVIFDADYSSNAQLIYPLAPSVDLENARLVAQCSYVNTSGSTKSYGESDSNEECFFALYETPPPPQIFGCVSPP